MITERNYHLFKEIQHSRTNTTYQLTSIGNYYFLNDGAALDKSMWAESHDWQTKVNYHTPENYNVKSTKYSLLKISSEVLRVVCFCWRRYLEK